MTDTPKIGVFKVTDRIVLKRTPNDGWVVSAHNGNPGYMDEVIGAYSNTDDMLSALSDALCKAPTGGPAMSDATADCSGFRERVMEWQSIETAPKDGTEFYGCSLDEARLFPAQRMKWGIAARPDEGVVCNSGQPWWINADGRHLAPRPTHWAPLTGGPRDE
jgi:hypothetical protein